MSSPVPSPFSTFYQLVANNLLASVANVFVWSSVIYWVYLETESVLGTSLIGGIYLVVTAFSGFWLGAVVDHNKKKTAMIISSLCTLMLFGLAFGVYGLAPESAFTKLESGLLWLVVLILLFGVIAGNLRNITLPTLTGILIPEGQRDKANGVVGMTMGISFAISNVAAGFVLGYTGMTGVLIAALSATALALLHLLFIRINEPGIVKTTNHQPKKVDLRGTLKTVLAVPGLLALIFFTTFNNFLGGVFMSLMDAYGLSLVSVQHWGLLWGFLSSGFILGGLLIAKKGLGTNPVKTLFLVNLALWTICFFFTIQPSIILLAIGLFLYMCLAPFVEASEHTIIQKVVPPERLGRVLALPRAWNKPLHPSLRFSLDRLLSLFLFPS